MDMKRACSIAAMVAGCAVPMAGQSSDELRNPAGNTDNVTTHSMGYDRKSYSPLAQINRSNVKRLVPVWSTSLMNDQGELSAPTRSSTSWSSWPRSSRPWPETCTVVSGRSVPENTRTSEILPT